MDWHPVISVQQRTPDSDFCHLSISNVRFAFWAFFRKPEKNSGLTPGQNDEPVTQWPRCERWPKWPIDPVTQWPSSMSDRYSKSIYNIHTLLYLCQISFSFVIKSTAAEANVSSKLVWTEFTGFDEFSFYELASKILNPVGASVIHPSMLYLRRG